MNRLDNIQLKRESRNVYVNNVLTPTDSGVLSAVVIAKNDNEHEFHYEFECAFPYTDDRVEIANRLIEELNNREDVADGLLASVESEQEDNLTRYVIPNSPEWSLGLVSITVI